MLPSGCHMIIKGKILQEFFRDQAENLRRIGGIGERMVEGTLLIKMHLQNGMGERLTLLGTAAGKKRVELLHVQIGKWPLRDRLHSKVVHVSLQLRQVMRPPGAKQDIFAAPAKEIFCHLRKESLLLQLFHLQADQLPRDAVHTQVDLRSYPSFKGAYDFPPFVQLHRTDFDYLKGQMRFFPLLSGRLVPFQIKNNIIHFPRCSLFQVSNAFLRSIHFFSIPCVVG